MTAVAAAKKRQKFNSQTFLSTIDGGRTIAAFHKKQTIFNQGGPSDAVQEGKVKLTVLSKTGKEASIGILDHGDFFGEGCLVGQSLRMCIATAVADCTVMRIEKKAMMEVIHREHSFSDMLKITKTLRNPALAALIRTFSWTLNLRC